MNTALTSPDEDSDLFGQLAGNLDYLRPEDLGRVADAYQFARKAHQGQFRASGDDYISHPVAVAQLCAQWKLDSEAVTAALLHDTIEDCGVTREQLVDRFGEPTAVLVDGLTKMDRVQLRSREASQAESFRKMLLAMARDVRVILIKLFDRLHNLRTLSAVASGKRQQIAAETLAIYAPIAHRLGLDKIYREFQDLSFQQTHPWRSTAIIKAMQKSRGNRRSLVSRVHQELARALQSLPFAVSISGREKTAYSIYTKMREQGCSFASISDIFAFRIVVQTRDECYRVLGALHAMYKPIPGRFLDYIAIPKVNGYQSLHTTMVHPGGVPLEFQIRTAHMHEIAESGVAAHWLYKSTGFDAELIRGEAVLQVGWLRSLLERREVTGDHNEFLEHVRLDLLGDSVYVFTPKSRVLTLPRGSTCVDFAYAIHTEVGDRCVAAKINGELSSLRTALKNGDLVEAITAGSAVPNPAWLAFVRTARARSAIRRTLKGLRIGEAMAAGERIFAQSLRVEGLLWPPDVRADDPVCLRLIAWSRNSSLDELFVHLGQGRKYGSIVAQRFARIIADWHEPERAARFLRQPADAAGPVLPTALILVDGELGTAMNRARCCLPIPGDAIACDLGRGDGATVHTANCMFTRLLRQREPDRWVSARWGSHGSRLFETELRLLVLRGHGHLAQLAQYVSDAVADIQDMKMSDPLEGQPVELVLRIGVRDRTHLAIVMRKLRRAPAVLRIARAQAY